MADAATIDLIESFRAYSASQDAESPIARAMIDNFHHYYKPDYMSDPRLKNLLVDIAIEYLKEVNGAQGDFATRKLWAIYTRWAQANWPEMEKTYGPR